MYILFYMSETVCHIIPNSRTEKEHIILHDCVYCIAALTFYPLTFPGGNSMPTATKIIRGFVPDYGESLL